MRLLTVLALMFGFVWLTEQGVQSQEKKEPTTSKVKGQLPAYWGKIDLSAEQKQTIYKIQAKYKDDVKKLKDQIAELEADERREMEKVLTAEQKKKLIEVITGEKPKEAPKDKTAPKDKEPAKEK